MWEFLFGKRKDEVLKQENVKIGDDFESRLRDSIKLKKIKKFNADSIKALKEHLQSNGWIQRIRPSYFYWVHKNYSDIIIKNDFYENYDVFTLTDVVTCKRLGVIYACDNEAIPKLEAILATYKRLTSI